MRAGRGLVLVVAAVAALATGCLRADIGVEVDGDGAGTLALSIYPTGASAREMGLGNGLDLEDLARNATSNVAGAKVSSVSDNGDDGVRIELPFDDYHQLAGALSTAQTVGGRPLQLIRSFEVTEGPKDTWSMRGLVDPRSLDPSVVSGVGGSRLPVTPGGSDDSVDVTLSVTLPGTVVASNASDRSGGTATWKLTGSGAATQLSMRTEPSGLSTLTIVLLACGGLLLVGVVLVLAGRGRTGTRRESRRRGRTTTAPPSKSWAPPQSPPVGAPTGPRQWSSPPPYSSHQVGAPDPTAPVPTAPVAAAAVPQGPVVARQAPVPPPVAVPPPVDTTPPVEPPVPAWTPPVSDRVGPPVLPPGFVPTPTTAFPETHSPGPPPGAVLPPGAVPPPESVPRPDSVPPPLPPHLEVPEPAPGAPGAIDVVAEAADDPGGGHGPTT